MERMEQELSKLNKLNTKNNSLQFASSFLQQSEDSPVKKRYHKQKNHFQLTFYKKHQWEKLRVKRKGDELEVDALLKILSERGRKEGKDWKVEGDYIVFEDSPLLSGGEAAVDALLEEEEEEEEVLEAGDARED